MELPVKLETDWNSSKEGLKRLNKYLDLCNQQSILSKSEGYKIDILQQWKLTILSIRRELEAKMNKTEIKEINNILKKYSYLKAIKETKNTPQGRITLINKKNFNKNWRLNDYLERKLRSMADKKGMLITDKQLADIGQSITENR